MTTTYKPFTPEGYDRIVQEREELWTVVRPDVVKRIADAAAEGDRSENAEYIYGKKRLRELDSRIRYLDGLLKYARVIELKDAPPDVVAFGAQVTFVDENSVESTWRIVGEGESDPKNGTISYTSAVAKALLGKQIDDECLIRVGDTRKTVEIVAISYD